MKLHTLALIGAMAVSGASLSMAQMTQPGTQPMPSTGTAPTTPPTHPAERGTPSNMSPGDTGGAMGKQKSSKAEAMQACKNLSSTEEQQTCMKQHKKGHMSKSKPGAEADKEQNGSGTGYSRPDSKP